MFFQLTDDKDAWPEMLVENVRSVYISQLAQMHLNTTAELLKYTCVNDCSGRGECNSGE